jgi:hypothetical protein
MIWWLWYNLPLSLPDCHGRIQEMRGKLRGISIRSCCSFICWWEHIENPSWEFYPCIE